MNMITNLLTEILFMYLILNNMKNNANLILDNVKNNATDNSYGR